MIHEIDAFGKMHTPFAFSWHAAAAGPTLATKVKPNQPRVSAKTNIRGS